MLNNKKIVLAIFVSLSTVQINAMERGDGADLGVSSGLRPRASTEELLGMSSEDLAKRASLCQIRQAEQKMQIQKLQLEELEARKAAASGPGMLSRGLSAVSGAAVSGYWSARTSLFKPLFNIPGTEREVSAAKGIAAVGAVAGVVVAGQKGYLNKPVGATKGFLASLWARVPAMPRFGAKTTK